MSVTAVIIGATASHAECAVPIKAGADRFGRTIAGTAVSDGTESAGYGAVTDRAGWAIVIRLAGIADLRGAAHGQQNNGQSGQGRDQDVKKSEELSGHHVLLHDYQRLYVEESINLSSPRLKLSWQEALRAPGCTVGPRP